MAERQAQRAYCRPYEPDLDVAERGKSPSLFFSSLSYVVTGKQVGGYDVDMDYYEAKKAIEQAAVIDEDDLKRIIQEAIAYTPYKEDSYIEDISSSIIKRIRPYLGHPAASNIPADIPFGKADLVYLSKNGTAMERGLASQCLELEKSLMKTAYELNDLQELFASSNKMMDNKRAEEMAKVRETLFNTIIPPTDPETLN